MIVIDSIRASGPTLSSQNSLMELIQTLLHRFVTYEVTYIRWQGNEAAHLLFRLLFHLLFQHTRLIDDSIQSHQCQNFLRARVLLNAEM